MPRFSIDDTVYRRDSGNNAATVTEVIRSDDDEVIYRLSYAEGGDGYWPESELFMSLEERIEAIGV
jgi:hypothetical protein